MKNAMILIFGWIFGRIYFFNIGKLLQHVSHRMMGIGNFENIKLSGEYFVVQKIRGLLKDSKIIFFDVGAGENGENSILINKLFSNSQIYLFEPMPKTFRTLRKNLKMYKHMNFNNVALSDKNGYLELWNYKGEQTQHATICTGRLHIGL